MKRPLFAAALVLVVVTVLRLMTGGAVAPPGSEQSSLPTDGKAVMITGRVCRKTNETISLNSVVLYQIPDNLNILRDNITFVSKSYQGISCKEEFICEVAGAEAVTLGSTVTVKGTFAPFSEGMNPGEFDSARYYRSIGVGGKIRKGQVLHEEAPTFPVKEFLYQLQRKGRARLYAVLPEKEASIVCALLLGDREELDDTTQELYKQNGILHILSISSLHVTALGMSLYRVLRRIGVPVRVSAVFGGIVIFLYGMMTGFGISACRAVFMYLLRMLAQMTGRTYDMLNALGAVGMGMLLYRPWYLTNTGFLLSYGAVLGIGIVYPALRKKMGESPPKILYGEPGIKRIARNLKKYVREQLLFGLSVTLCTVPIQLWFFCEVPVHTLLVNLLILPFTKPLLICGAAVLLLPFAEIPGAIDCGILWWYEAVCRLFESFGILQWNPGKPEVWQMVLYYGMLLGFVLRVRKPKGRSRELLGMYRKLRKWNGLISILWIVLMMWIFELPFNTETKAVFLSVGQGDCCVLQTETGRTYLIDCGSSSRGKVGEYVLLPYLKYNGINTIDGVLVSHADEDHVSGIQELLLLAEENGITVKQLVLPDIEEKLWQKEFGTLVDAASSAYDGNGIPVRCLAAGESWYAGGAEFLCLHPQAPSDLPRIRCILPPDTA